MGRELSLSRQREKGLLKKYRAEEGGEERRRGGEEEGGELVKDAALHLALSETGLLFFSLERCERGTERRRGIKTSVETHGSVFKALCICL